MIVQATSFACLFQRQLVDTAFPFLSSYDLSYHLTVDLLQHLPHDEPTLFISEFVSTYYEVKRHHYLIWLLVSGFD